MLTDMSSTVLKLGNDDSSHIFQHAFDDTSLFCRFCFMKSFTNERNVSHLKVINSMDSTV